MSELWADETGYSASGDLTPDPAPYGDASAPVANLDDAVADLQDAVADLELAVANLEPSDTSDLPAQDPDSGGPADGGYAQPWNEPVTCCGIGSPGWDVEFTEQLAASEIDPATSATSVVLTGQPEATFSSWQQVQEDPRSAIVSVSQPVSSLNQPGWSVVDNNGQPVDPDTLFGTSFVVGGHQPEHYFTVLEPSWVTHPTLEPIAGTSPVGDYTITDEYGRLVDPDTLFPHPAAIGAPMAGLSNVGHDPGGVDTMKILTGQLVMRGDSYLAALSQGIADQMTRIATNQVWR